jgi:tetratricopeptide (TPR) repeat protein
MTTPDRQLHAWALDREKRGDLAGAVQGFLRAGAAEDAARVLAGQGRHAEAGKALLGSIPYRRNRTSNLSPADRKTALKAAIWFARGGEVRQAVELFLVLGERTRAVELLRSVGDHVNAARVETDPHHRGDLIGYADPEDERQAAVTLKGAHQLEAAGKLEAAFDAFCRLRQHPAAARLALVLGRPAEAAELLGQAGQPFDAALCYRKAGDVRRALELLVRVPREDPRYRQACVYAIAAASELGVLDFQVEHLVGKLVASGPESDAELEAFYLLGELYARHALPDNAADCCRKVLARAPGYRDTAARLRQLELGSRASSEEIGRIFADEQAFRAAAAEVRAAPLLDELPLPDLPELPDLPDLPATPPASDRGPVPGADRTAPAAPLIEGALVEGRYRLEAKIGQGGMAAVFRATDLALEETIAIKFASTAAVDAGLLQRFKQEVTLSRQFSHPNVIRLHDFGSYGEHRYITMELLSGSDLAALLGEEPIELERGLDYLGQACAGLQCVHERGVVHRDIKPENFFVTRDGVLKVMDFGIAKRSSAARALTQAGMMAGTPQYMSPEQINDFASVTHLADIYALGCLAYKMFTGQVPFDHQEVMPLLMMHVTHPPPAPRARNPRIPPALEAIMLRLVAKTPAARVQSCRELAALLTALRR